MTIQLTKEDCFFPLKKKSPITSELLAYSQSVNDWESSTMSNKFSFLQSEIPSELVERDDVLKAISAFKKPHIYMMPAWTYYSLHTDTYRGVAINMAFAEYDAVSFFRAGSFRRNQMHIHELQYEVGTYYLFNTQVRHAVVNRGTDRWVVSAGIPGLSYEEAMKQFKEQGWL